tara:strand:+ start:484 stop:708 length:225 start_codon:yes stop_codon:yes gene_type:complete
MIDTDKYEGHNIAMMRNTQSGMATHIEREANWNLVQDAPLLLAEVKRLRAWKKLVSDIVQQQDGLREVLKELIE